MHIDCKCISLMNIDESNMALVYTGSSPFDALLISGPAHLDALAAHCCRIVHYELSQQSAAHVVSNFIHSSSSLRVCVVKTRALVVFNSAF